MELEIEIFIHSNETLQKKDAGMGYSILECDTRLCTFYFISCITPLLDDLSGQELCDIWVGEKSFTATKTYEEIKQLIHDCHAGKCFNKD